MRISRHVLTGGLFLGCLVVLAGIAVPRAAGWPSDNGANPLNKVHTLLTQYAIDQSPATADNRYATAILDGANTELHELDASDRDKGIGLKYAVNVESMRIKYGGSNEGCANPQGWWNDALSAYRISNSLSGDAREKARQRAWFNVGILLHMIEDMGVPAYANLVHHQASLSEFDNFEALSLNNWEPELHLFRPSLNGNQADPRFADPSKYYQFSRDWTQEDAPNYNNRDSFPKTWGKASPDEKALMRRRQGRTEKVAQWALEAASRAFDY